MRDRYSIVFAASKKAVTAIYAMLQDTKPVSHIHRALPPSIGLRLAMLLTTGGLLLTLGNIRHKR